MNQLEKTDNQEEPSGRNLTKPNKKSWLAWLAIIIAVISVVLCSVLWQRLKQTNIRLLQINQTLSHSVKDQSMLTQQATTFQQGLKQQAGQLQENQASLSRLLESISTDKSNWLITDAVHLIKLANLTLYFQHDIPTTIVLLKTANQRLAASGDPKLYPVRKLLVNDIIKLQTVPKVAVSTLYLQLQALRQETMKLPLALSHYQPNKADNLLTRSVKPSDSWWQRTVDSTANALSKVLVIRKRQSPVEPLLSPNQHRLLLQATYILYAQAQWGVMQRQQMIYQSSLKQLIELITTYFVADNQSQAILAKLDHLVKRNIAPQLPNVSDSLDALQRYLQTKQRAQLLGGAPKKLAASKVSAKQGAK